MCSERVLCANSSSRICRLSSAATPSMRVVKPSLTNSARRPVSGCVRTTGCATSCTCASWAALNVGRQFPSFCSWPYLAR
ncbi:Uncharacterised protein [Bordetella pertussis]|nr:Uncharacterised protein [Bordetella pertussis]